MLTVSDMAAVLGRMSYKSGWRFEVYEGRHEGPHLRIAAENIPDAYEPGVMARFDVHSSVPPMRDEDAFLDWLLWRLQRIEIHECREFMKLDGKPYSNPHGEDADKDL
jgi:hypothetical protein